MPSPATTHELSTLSDDVLRDIAARGQVRKFQKNAVIIQEGDAGDSMYIILSGRVKVYASDDSGKEVILDIFGPGEQVGEMVLDGGPRSASVVTLEPSTFAVVSRAELRDYVVQHPDFAVYLISRLIKRTRNATNNIKTLALMDVYGRVARLLLSLADDVEGKLVVRDKLTQQDIADRVGASREMISRIMKDLQAGGYLEIQDRVITMHRRPPAHW
jgi:CRP/FNR family cyclic AMP-dependent transcriptional regulator